MYIQRETTASFDVDCQKGFTPICPNELPVTDGHLIVDELNKTANLIKYRIGSKDVHPSNAIWIATNENPQFSPIVGENVDVRWNAHCMSGTVGAELLDGLPKVSEYDFFVFKGIEPDLHPYSAVYHDLKKKMSTGVIEWLLDRGIQTIIVQGLALDYCVYQTVIDLLPHFNVIVNKSATKSIGDFDVTVKILEKMGVKFVENANEIISE